MSFKKGDKVIFAFDNEAYYGVCIGNTYKSINENSRRVEIMLYNSGEEIDVNIKYLQKVEL